MNLIDINSDFDEVDDSVEHSTASENDSNFIGKAYIYNDEVFINTITGEGYDVVLKKMKKYIDWYSGKIRLAGFEREDIKQLIIVLLLDGIRRYNPKLNIKLSTFLYVHIKNRLISRIKEETRQSLNATFNETLYRFICPCGTTFNAGKNDALNAKCISCNSKIDNNWIIRAEHFEPISLDQLMQSMTEDDMDRASRIHYNGQKNNFVDFFGKINTVDDFDRTLDICNVLQEEDDITRKIANLMYSHDYSITDAAKEVGLTCWAASLRLKKLKNKKHIRDFFLDK